MKITILTNDYPPMGGGISYYMKGLKEGLDELGAVCSVLFCPLAKLDHADNSKVSMFPISGKWTYQRVSACREILKKCTYKILDSDLVVIGTWSPLGTAFIQSFPDHKIKSILLAHGNDVLEPSRSFRYRRKMKKVFNTVTYVATASNYTAGLCRRYTRREAVPIGAGLDERFFNEDQIGSKIYETPITFKILSVGRLVERKGFDSVIRSLVEIDKEHQDWTYTIIGEGPYRSVLEKLIAANKFQDKISIQSGIGFKDLLSWYRNSDIFIMTSRLIREKGEVEGLGLVYLEAGASGLPVIAGRGGGVEDAVINGVNGLMVDPRSVQDIARAIRELLENKELRVKLGETGKRIVKKNWRWEIVARRILKVAGIDSLPAENRNENS